jgi:oligopeptide/dipeptide ABC transporter ATP-binding protein
LVERLRHRQTERVVAVDHASFEMRKGETLGIVGESGSGKSTLARCLVRLYVPDGGRILVEGVDIAHAGAAEVRALRRRVQLIFQDPYSSLNPRLTVESALLEAGRVHGRVAHGAERQFVSDLLETVGLTNSTSAARPRQLSGGQRQRVAIARALAVGPDLLIADEAVSGLDVSIQAQILALFDDLRRQFNLTIIFISHQLSVVSHVADRVAVMYLGSIVELGPVSQVFASPQHPYTKALLDADPIPDPTRKRAEAAALGDIPSSIGIPTGCRFRSRCPYEQHVCEEIDPPLAPLDALHSAACHVLPFRNAQGH